MALTTIETEQAKKLVQIKMYELQIETINKIAYDLMHTKQNEIETIDNKRKADVQIKQDLITTLQNTYA